MRVQIVKKDIKHIRLKVRPDGEVVLTVPPDCSEGEIAHVLRKREEWIAQKIAFFKSHTPLVAREYVSGENCPYLGRNYRLKVIESLEEGVKLQRGYVQLFVREREDFERKKRLLKAWFRQKAQIHFGKALAVYTPLVGVEPRTVTIREMKSRWGSCNPAKGTISLNLRLIEKPSACIEYVVLHELAHLIHPGHDRKFYSFLDLHMPDWRRRKRKLEAG